MAAFVGLAAVALTPTVVLALTGDRVPELAGEVTPLDGYLTHRNQPATVALGDGGVLVWGGRNVSSWSGHVYDPDADDWERLPRAPGPGRSAAAATWTGTEVLIWGGETWGGEVRGGDAGDDDLPDPGGIALDPVAGTWRELPDAPHGLTGSRARRP